MTRDEGVNLIKLQLGYRQTGDAEIVLFMQLAQSVLESAPTKPWFMTSERASVLMTVNDERVPVPDDFIQELDMEGLMYIPDDTTIAPIPLRKDGYDVLQANYSGAENGPPEAYALLGDYFRFFPPPDAAYTVRMIYIQQLATFTTSIENGWLKWAPLLLLGTTLDFMTTPLRDQAAKAQAKDWITVGSTLLYTQNESREHANQEYQMGGPHN